MEPTAPAIRKTPEEIEAMFTAKEESQRTYLSGVLTSYSVAHDPETITYADALNAVILNYQNLLDAAGAPYDAYILEAAWVPTVENPVEYHTYLMRQVATIP